MVRFSRSAKLVLRVAESSDSTRACVSPAPRADFQAPLHPAYPIVATCLDHLTVDSGDAQHVAHGLVVELEAVAGHQDTMCDFAAMDGFVENQFGVPVRAPPHHLGRPESGPDLDRREQRCRVRLVADERTKLVGL